MGRDLRTLRARHVRWRLRVGWKTYLAQSLLTFAVTFVLLLILTLEHVVIVASIGSVAFLVFIRPHSFMAQPRNVLFGQLLGVVSGLAFSWLHHAPMIDMALADAAAVGLCVLLMALFKADHSPAAGTALGVTIAGGQLSVVLSVIGSVAVLVGAHEILQARLKDL